MKKKIFEPATHNEESPAEGMAAVNTFMPEESSLEEMEEDQAKKVSNEDDEQREDLKSR